MSASYVLSNHGELVVAAHAADERAITRALKQLDDRLVLAINLDEETGQHVWQVLVRYGGDRPAQVVMSWRNEYGKPLPLSHALVEEVKRLRETDTFAAMVAHNRNMREAGNHDDFLEATEIAAEMIPYIKGRRGGGLRRGVGLRMARDRRRARGENC